MLYTGTAGGRIQIWDLDSRTSVPVAERSGSFTQGNGYWQGVRKGWQPVSTPAGWVPALVGWAMGHGFFWTRVLCAWQHWLWGINFTGRTWPWVQRWPWGMPVRQLGGGRLQGILVQIGCGCKANCEVMGTEWRWLTPLLQWINCQCTLWSYSPVSSSHILVFSCEIRAHFAYDYRRNFLLPVPLWMGRRTSLIRVLLSWLFWGWYFLLLLLLKMSKKIKWGEVIQYQTHPNCVPHWMSASTEGQWSVTPSFYMTFF